MTPLCIFDGSGRYREYLVYDPDQSKVTTTAVAPPRTAYLQITGGEILGPLVFHPTFVVDYDPDVKEIVNKEYVGRKFAEFDSLVNANLCPLSGGVDVTSHILINNTSLNDLTAVDKQYVTASVGEYVKKEGDQMTGPLVLHTSDINGYEDTGFDTGETKAVPRAYVDQKISVLDSELQAFLTDRVVDEMTGHLVLDCCQPLTDNTVVAIKWLKKYIDCVFAAFSDVPEIILGQEVTMPAGVLYEAVFSAKCKVIKQAMCGGGPEGSNYPLSFFVKYEGLPGTNTSSDSETTETEVITYAQNIFSTSCMVETADEVRTDDELAAYQASVAAKNGYLYNHIQAADNSWFRFAVDLTKLAPRPYKINSVWLRGAGAGTQVQLADVSLTASMATGGEGPPIAHVILTNKINDARNFQLMDAVGAKLVADVRIRRQNLGCPLSIRFGYHATTGYVTQQQNFSIGSPCIDSGDSTVVTANEWTRFIFDLKTLNNIVAVEEVSVRGIGTEIDADIKNLAIDVCRMEGGVDPVPRVPGVPMVPAQLAVPETAGTPGVPGQSGVPRMYIDTDVVQYNDTGPYALTVADLNLKFKVERYGNGDICPVVAEIKYNSVDTLSYTIYIAFGPTGALSHYTTYIQEITLNSDLDITISLLDIAVAPLMEITGLRLLSVGIDVKALVTGAQITVAPATSDWVSRNGKLYKNLGEMTHADALIASADLGATLICVESIEEAAWVRTHFDHRLWLGAEGSLAEGWSWSNGSDFLYNNFGAWVKQEGLESYPTMHPTDVWVLTDSTEKAWAIAEKPAGGGTEAEPKPIILSPNFSNATWDQWEVVTGKVPGAKITHKQTPTSEYCTVVMERSSADLIIGRTTVRQDINKKLVGNSRTNVTAAIRIRNQGQGGCPLVFKLSYDGDFGTYLETRSYGYNPCTDGTLVDKDVWDSQSVAFTVDQITKVNYLEITSSGSEFEVLVDDVSVMAGPQCYDIEDEDRLVGDYNVDIVFIISNNAVMASHESFFTDNNETGKQYVIKTIEGFMQTAERQGVDDTFNVAFVPTCGGESGFLKGSDAVRGFLSSISFTSRSPGDAYNSFRKAYNILIGSPRHSKGAKKLIITIMNTSLSPNHDNFDTEKLIRSHHQDGVAIKSIALSVTFPFDENYAITDWLDNEDYYSTEDYNKYIDSFRRPPSHESLPKPSYQNLCFLPSSFPMSGDALYSEFDNVVKATLDGSCAWGTNTGCTEILSNGSMDSMNNWNIIENDGQIEIKDLGTNKVLHMLYKNPLDGSDAEEIGPIAAIPPDPGSPYKPMIPAISEVPAIPGIDPELVCASILPNIVDSVYWTTTKNTGITISYPVVDGDPILNLKYSGTGVRSVTSCHELVKTGSLDGNYSGWCVQKSEGRVTFPETTLTRSCGNEKKQNTVAMDMILNDSSCDDAGKEDICG